jgi:hypothetical protein
MENMAKKNEGGLLKTIEVYCRCGRRLFEVSTNVLAIGPAEIICSCGAVAKFNGSLIPTWDDHPVSVLCQPIHSADTEERTESLPR